MAVLERLLKATRSWRSLNPFRPPSYDLPRRFYTGPSRPHTCCNVPAVQHPKMAFNIQDVIYPAFLASLSGVTALGIAYADSSNEVSAATPLPKDSPTSYVDLEESAKKERQRIEMMLRDKGMRNGSYPRFKVAVKGQKVTFKFQLPASCDVSQLIANIASQLGLKPEKPGGGSDMLLRAWDSSVAWQITLSSVEKKKETEGKHEHQDTNSHEEDLCVLIFGSLITSDKAEIEFMKKGTLTPTELEAFVSALKLAGSKLAQGRTVVRKPGEGTPHMPSADQSIAKLNSMGVRIYGLNEPNGSPSKTEMSWDNIAGYDQQKREIEDTILLALQSPEVYDDIARGTRRKFESNRPRAILFEGPPGTGKTSCARVIANQAGVPLLYVPLEAVVSKYYGESERLFGTVFSLANELPNGAIIFLDEVDSFAVSRDSEIHEATRRVLSVLLRQIDGFEQDKKVVVIAATNRKQDLDSALISRFDSMIYFGLPDKQNRQEIITQYAKHLTESEIAELAQATEEMSGRDIRDVCQQAERAWASKLIRGQVTRDGEKDSLPPVQTYLDSATIRQNALLSIAAQKDQNNSPRSKKSQLDMC